MPESRKAIILRQENRSAPQQQNQQPRRVRHIKDQQQDEEDEPEETVVAEAAFYIKELIKECATVNSVRPSLFKEINNVSLNKDTGGEFWF